MDDTLDLMDNGMDSMDSMDRQRHRLSGSQGVPGARQGIAI